VYAASLMGITGARESVGTQAASLVSRTRVYTSLPVAVGLGVRDGAQAREVAGFADGVIVGSAFVQRLLAASQGGGPADGLASVRELAADLAAGVRAAASSPAGAAGAAGTDIDTDAGAGAVPAAAAGPGGRAGRAGQRAARPAQQS
jgi:hypothetical protein